MDTNSEELWIRRLLDVGRSLMTELDLGAVLDRVLETAREITGARYAALGILNEERSELEQFLTSGVDEETHRAIGDLPRGTRRARSADRAPSAVAPARRRAASEQLRLPGGTPGDAAASWGCRS